VVDLLRVAGPARRTTSNWGRCVCANSVISHL